MSERVSIRYSDIRTLAAHLCDISGIVEDEMLERTFVEKFDLDLESFSTVVEYLVPLIRAKIHPSCNVLQYGFASDAAWFIRTTTTTNKKKLLGF